MKTKRTRPYGLLILLLTLATMSAGLLGSGCSHAPTSPPYDSVVVDRSNPSKTVIVLNGSCPAPNASAREPAQVSESKKPYKYTSEDGKTYYFSSDSDRTRFIEAHDINSRY